MAKKKIPAAHKKSYWRICQFGETNVCLPEAYETEAKAQEVLDEMEDSKKYQVMETRSNG